MFWSPGTASALDDSRIADGRDIGASAAFVAEHRGQMLTFEASGDKDLFRDRETGTLNVTCKRLSASTVGL